MRKKAKWSALVASLISAVSLAAATGAGSQVFAAPDAFTIAKQKYTQKNYQGALNDFKALSAKYPTRSDFHYYLALCNQCLSRSSEAKNEYKWVMDNDRGPLSRMATAGYNQLAGARGSISSGGSTSVASSSASNSPLATQSSSAGASTSVGSVKTVLDFYTTWCGPCKEMEPTFEEAKSKFRGVTFKRLDAEQPANQALVQQYKVQAYPTIVMLDGSGKQIFNQAGQLMGDNFFQLIEKAGGK